ncbi:MAG: hypothetical protein JSS61_04085 [Verrucomicrobia bacterium]|nr:hypothetical protein [Verrucomicrobiota bacterium]
MSFLKVFGKCALFGLLSFLVARFCTSKTDGFSIARISSDLPYDPAWDSSIPPPVKEEEIAAILSQTYHYLGCGGQCYAFESDDRQYVLKFFKHRFRKPFTSLVTSWIPTPWNALCKRKLAKGRIKLERDFASYKIAYEDLPNLSGLLYIHLNKGKSPVPSVTIVDKLQIPHVLNLGEFEFILQKKAKLAYSHIDALMKKKDLFAARRALHAMMHVIIQRCKQGIYDEDPRLHRNLGFIGQTPIFIDVGRFRRDQGRSHPEVYKEDLMHITSRLRTWLEEEHPMLIPFLEEELDAIGDEI